MWGSEWNNLDYHQDLRTRRLTVLHQGHFNLWHEIASNPLFVETCLQPMVKVHAISQFDFLLFNTSPIIFVVRFSDQPYPTRLLSLFHDLWVEVWESDATNGLSFAEVVERITAQDSFEPPRLGVLWECDQSPRAGIDFTNLFSDSNASGKRSTDASRHNQWVGVSPKFLYSSY
mgnify:CR=1 FL=1